MIAHLCTRCRGTERSVCSCVTVSSPTCLLSSTHCLPTLFRLDMSTTQSLSNSSTGSNGSIKVTGDPEVSAAGTRGLSTSAGETGAPAASVPALDEWEAELKRLAADSTGWGHWNVNELFEKLKDVPKDVVDRCDLTRAVNMDDLSKEMAKWNEEIEHMNKSEADTDTADSGEEEFADLMSLDELNESVTKLVADLKETRDRLVPQVAFLKALDGMSQDTEKLSLKDDTIAQIDELADVFHLAKHIVESD